VDKKQLRIMKSNERRAFSEVEAIQKSKEIISKLKHQPDFINSKKIFCYASEGNEVYTHELIKSMLAEGKTVLVPKIANGKMIASKLETWNGLVLEKGFLEPADVDEDIPQLCIVPGVAFTEKLERLGRGGGHYDEYLSEHKIRSIALAYEFQIVENIPTEEHDQKVEKIITERRILS